MRYPRAPLLSLFLLVLAACGGGSDDSGADIQVQGAAQKGPFVVNSTVLVNLLTPLGQATGETLVTKTVDSLGNFTFTASRPGPVQIVAEGYHYNELTGRISDSPLTLRGVVDVTADNQQTAYVNVLTHLINDRVLVIIAAGNANASEAITQAQQELLTALEEVISPVQIEKFTRLSVYDVEGTESEGNAYLLALSATLYQYATDRSISNGGSVDAELTALLNGLSVDMAENGLLDDAGHIEGLRVASASVDADTVSSNLESQSRVAMGQSLSVPRIDSHLSQLLIVSPASDAFLSTTAQVKFLAPPSSDDTDYELLVDAEVVATLTGEPYEFEWNPYFWSDSARHTLLVRRVGANGSVITSNLVPVSVAVSNSSELKPLAPESGVYLDAGAQAELSWESVIGASSYEVQLGKDRMFTQLLPTQATVTTSYLTGALEAGPYYWRYRATNALNKTGSWSAPAGLGVGVFARRYDTPESERPNVVIQARDGGFVTLGSTNQGMDSRLHLLKVNSVGDALWSHEYGESTSTASGLRETKDGGFIVVGSITSATAGKWDAYIVKTGATGKQEWNTVLDDALSNKAVAVVEVNEGYLVINSTYEWEPTDVVAHELVKLDQQGHVQWRKPLFAGQAQFKFIHSLEVTADGGYLLGGTFDPRIVDPDLPQGAFFLGGAFLARLDAAAEVVWDRSFSALTGEDFVVSGGHALETHDGGYILEGHGILGGYIFRADSTGGQLWVKAFDYRELFLSSSSSPLSLTSEGDVVVSASAEGGPVLICIDVTAGSEKWRKKYTALTGTRGVSVAKTEDGGYILAGDYSSALTNHNSDIVLIKTNVQGETLNMR